MWSLVLVACFAEPAAPAAPAAQIEPVTSPASPAAPADARARRRGRAGPDQGRQGDRDVPERSYPTKGELNAAPDPCARASEPGLYDLTIQAPHASRTIVSVPPGAGPHRILFLLHGGYGEPEEILTQTQALRYSDEWNTIVVAPSGVGGASDDKSNWNSRDKTGMIRDDVGYLDALAREVKRKTCGKDVVVMGFSNGSMMANRWLCQGETLQGAVTAAGRLGVDSATCRNARPHLNYVGTDDDQYRTEHPTTPETMDLWARINGCKEGARETKNGRITERSWAGCRVPTLEYVIEGFPHAWPQPNQRGRSPVDATREGWEWLSKNVP